MDHVVQSLLLVVAFILCAAVFAYLRRFIADVISGLCEETDPLKVVARLVVLLLAVCFAIVFGAGCVALILTLVRGLAG